MSESTETEVILRPQNGTVAVSRAGFGSTEIEMRQETAAVAVAERARTEVEARYKMALARPRNILESRRRLLDHCKRKRFAEVARYSKPVGGSPIVGPSIRFVETALQEFGNVLPEATVVYDDHEQRIVRISLTDLERNITYSKDVPIRKVVERRSLRKGQEAIGQRRNAGGNLVYLVEATEDDLLVKQGSAESKAIRTLGLRILPADIVEDAMEQVTKTLRSEDEDPAAARKRMVDAFAALGVYPRNLEEYLGHPLEQTTPAERESLLAIHAAIKEGEATWAEIAEVQGKEDAAPKQGKAAQILKQRAEKRAQAEGGAAE